MKYINKQNIEEYIFDYYEGNLNELQKTEVLSFIHQNQEFESLFAQWAMTYALKDDIPEKYDISKTWYKDENKGIGWKNKGLIIGCVLLTFIGTIFWYNSTEKSSEREMIKNENAPLINQIHTQLSKQSIDKMKSIKPFENVVKTENKLESASLDTSHALIDKNNVLEIPENIPAVEEKIVQPSSTTHVEDLSKGVISKDSAEAKEIIPVKKQVKKKIKLRLNYIQHDDFKPVNENF